MKRYIITILILTFAQTIFAQEDTLTLLDKFIVSHPICMEEKILSENCTANISANENELLLQISIEKPEIQMDFLMRNWSIYIDPAGKKRKKYIITLPAGIDVKESMLQFAPKEENRKENREPDLFPLIFALNNYGATYEYGSEKIFLGQQRFYINLDKNSRTLIYNILIPLKPITSDKKIQSIWSVGLAPSILTTPPVSSEHNQPGMMPPPPPRQNQGVDYPKEKKWIEFNFEKILNLNN